MTENIDFASLHGEHKLSGVDRDTVKLDSYCDEANVLRFVIDGKAYEAMEDPSDGYRSSLDYLRETDKPVKNTFAPVRVIGRAREDGTSYYEKNDVLEFIDAVTGKLVLAVGTENFDDYYPSCVLMFDPTAMACNA